MKPCVLNTGATMPAIGFGTWEITPDDNAKQAVLAALESGYRLIDAARIYGNESGVGEAIRESGVPRQELFVTTKLWNDDQGYDHTVKACQASLEKLGLDYLDLYLIHWPATRKRHDSWRAFEQLVQDGLIKAAGVANYTIKHLQELMDRSELVPAVNQFEFHPYIYEQQASLLQFCQQHDIVVEAYSPLRRVAQMVDKPVAAIAKRLKRTPQQVMLRWCLQHRTVPLPRSTNPKHMQDNYQVFDFKLTDEDMQALNSMSDGERVTWDPAGMG